MSTSSGRICCSISGDRIESLAQEIRSLPPSVDVIEIRLDTMKNPDVNQWITACAQPLLFTNRPVWEGGMFDGREEDRLQQLFYAVQANAAYIDIELATAPALRTPLLAAAESALTQTIISSHDFSNTPKDHQLADILNQMMDSGADIGKIVTTAHTSGDVIRVLGLLESAENSGFPLSAFCMGKAGRISRFATYYLGGYMTYVAVDSRQATAPGQFSAQTFDQLTTLFTQNAN